MSTTESRPIPKWVVDSLTYCSSSSEGSVIRNCHKNDLTIDVSNEMQNCWTAGQVDDKNCRRCFNLLLTEYVTRWYLAFEILDFGNLLEKYVCGGQFVVEEGSEDARTKPKRSILSVWTCIWRSSVRGRNWISGGQDSCLVLFWYWFDNLF